MLNWLTKLVDRSTYSQGRTALPRDRRSRASPEQISAWRAFARAFLAVTRLTEVSLRGTQLDPSDYDVLVTLAQAPAEGVRPSELAERVLLTKSGITRLVDRLVERGLIERHVC
ncbi:MAG: MarR family transcriptional regulator, partial [Chloroflexi bacterium]|nr:MarR family transcriptional regulator [Chloroflexota bacterium]